MSTSGQLAAIAGGLIAAELLTRAEAPTGTPGRRAPEALAPLKEFKVNPCGGAIGARAESLSHLWATDETGRRCPQDYAAAWSLQRVSLEEQFGAVQRRYCSGNTCVPLWGTRPAAPSSCMMAVAKEWAELRQRLERAADAHPGILAVPNFKGSSWQESLDLVLELEGLVLWNADEPNRDHRFWDTLNRLAIALSGAVHTHGNAAEEAAAELWDTVSSADSYGRVVAGVAGAVSKVLGDTVANFLLSDTGATLAVGVAGYFIVRKAL